MTAAPTFARVLSRDFLLRIRFKAPASAAALAVAGVLALPAAAQAALVDLGLASNFNVFALGNFNSRYSDTEGAVAVQGNATLQGYSVNLLNQGGYAGQSLVVGGNLSFNSGSIQHGNAAVGGTASTSSLGFNGTLQQGAAPFSFADAAQQLTTLSTALGSAAATGTTTYKYGGATFTGNGTAGTQVFEVDGADLLSVNHFNFSKLSTGQTLIFNIFGERAGFQSAGLGGFGNYNVLFNFVDATELVLNSVGVFGSILAPLASINGGGGQINGNVVVKDWNTNIQINNNHLFTAANVALPEPPPAAPPSTSPDSGSMSVPTSSPESAPTQAVPEPGTLALLLPALALLGVATRRREGARAPRCA